MDKPRMIMLTVDDLLRLLHDYCGEEDVPASARPLTLRFRPTDGGKIGLLCTSDDWQTSEPLEIKFHLSRTYTVGG